MSRHVSTRVKVPTQFGPIYIHVDCDADGRPTGGWISHPSKEPLSRVSQLLEDLSHGLNEALEEACGMKTPQAK